MLQTFEKILAVKPGRNSVVVKLWPLAANAFAAHFPEATEEKAEQTPAAQPEKKRSTTKKVAAEEPHKPEPPKQKTLKLSFVFPRSGHSHENGTEANGTSEPNRSKLWERQIEDKSSPHLPQPTFT